MQEAKTIDQAIEILGQLIEKSIEEESRVGYFLSLYYMVTVAVKEAIEAQSFEDNERMHRLDVIFANYFFKNVEHHDSVWNSFFQARNVHSYVITQHLLLGMNAHINYDLAQAVVDTQSHDLETLHKDFLAINDILYKGIDKIQNKLYKTSLFLKVIDYIGLRFDEAYMDFSMIKARDEAWENALKLSAMNEDERLEHLKLMQEKTLKMAQFVKKPSFIYNIFRILNKISEKSSIKFNLLALKPF